MSAQVDRLADDEARALYTTYNEGDGDVVLALRSAFKAGATFCSDLLEHAVRSEIAEEMVQAAFFRIAAEGALGVELTGPARAAVPPHWRGLAEAEAEPWLSIVRGPVDPASEDLLSKYREHSVLLNQMAWKIAKAVGDVTPGVASITADPMAQLERLIAKAARADATKEEQR